MALIAPTPHRPPQRTRSAAPGGDRLSLEHGQAFHERHRRCRDRPSLVLAYRDSGALGRMVASLSRRRHDAAVHAAPARCRHRPIRGDLGIRSIVLRRRACGRISRSKWILAGNHFRNVEIQSARTAVSTDGTTADTPQVRLPVAIYSRLVRLATHLGDLRPASLLACLPVTIRYSWLA